MVELPVVQTLPRYRLSSKQALLCPLGAFVLLGVLLPLSVLFYASFCRQLEYGGIAWGHHSLDAYTSILFERDFDGQWVFQWDYLSTFLRSLWLAGLATALCLLTGFPTALFIAKQPSSRKVLWLSVVLAPFVVSLVVRVYAWMLLLADGGLLNKIVTVFTGQSKSLHLLYNEGATLLGLVYVFFPFAVLPLFVSLNGVDWEQVEAASTLGATPMRVLRLVIMPACLSGLMAAALLVFVPALGAYVVSDLLGGSRVLMMGNLVQLAFTTHRDWPFGAALSIVLTGTVLLGFRVIQRQTEMASGSSIRPSLGMFTWTRWIAASMLGFLYAPILAMVGMSFNSGDSALVWEGFGLSGYVSAMRDDLLLHAAEVSIGVAVAAALAATVIGLCAAIALRGSRQGALVTLMMVPLVVPEAVLAIAMLLAFSIFGLEQGFWSVLFAHTVFCLPVAYLPMWTSLLNVEATQLDAAATLGATPWTSFWRITWPLILPDVMSAVALAFLTSLDDFVTSFFVAGAGMTTLPVYIYSALKLGLTPKVNAISTVMALAAVGAVMVSAWVWNKRTRLSWKSDSASSFESIPAEPMEYTV